MLSCVMSRTITAATVLRSYLPITTWSGQTRRAETVFSTATKRRVRATSSRRTSSAVRKTSRGRSWPRSTPLFSMMTRPEDACQTSTTPCIIKMCPSSLAKISCPKVEAFVVGVDVAQLNLHRMESDDLDVTAIVWCGGWDSNPRTPTGQGPEPCAFDLAWQHGRHHNNMMPSPARHWTRLYPAIRSRRIRSEDKV